MLHNVGIGITQSRFQPRQIFRFKTCPAEESSGSLLASSTTIVTSGGKNRFRRRRDDRMFILRVSAALIMFVTCKNDRPFISVASAAANNVISEDKRVNDSRKLGRAVPARKIGFARRSRSVNNFWWGSGTEPIVDYDGGWGSGWGGGLPNYSKSSKSSSKAGKSGKAKQIIVMPPQPVQQIIIYIPSPTKKPITERPTISPKPTSPPTALPTAPPTALPTAPPTAPPTLSPIRHPTMYPTGSPSFVSSASPSQFPTGFPTGRPTFDSSEHPSGRPSGKPSYIPSIQQSEMPSVSPSGQSSLVPSSRLTSSPTSKPESFLSSTIAPSAIGVKSVVPTFVDTPKPMSSKTNKPVDTAKPTKEAKTSKPSPSVSDEASVPPTPTNGVNTTSPTTSSSSNIPTLISLVPTSATTPEATISTRMPTVVPTMASSTDSPVTVSTPPTTTPTYMPSISSTSGSYIPTIEVEAPATDAIVDERTGLQMFLYGIDTLTTSRTSSYEEETRKYIEDFYNTDNDPGSLLSTLKDSVYDVIATVKVTDWTQPVNPTLAGSRRKLTNETAADKAKVIVLDVTEPCTGESPLIVTFSLKLHYLVDDPELSQSDLIIAFPFRTVDFRTTYIENYLQSGGEFDGLYCTSRIVFPGGKTPIPSVLFTPAPSSPGPTLSPTIAATTSVPTIGMTAVPSGASDKPTTDTIVDERKGLQMYLYGIDLLTPSRTKSYELETKNYIEDFYNAKNESGSHHSTLRGSVYAVSAAVKVTDWTQPVNPTLVGNRRIFSTRKINQPNVTAEGKAKVIVLDVTEPCTGESPLIVTFSLKLQYRVDDPKLIRSDVVVSFPFGTVSFRTTYIKDYLQPGGEFNRLYCTSRIVFPGEETLTPSSLSTTAPSSPGLSGTPTRSISFLPTTEGTALPTLAVSGTPTLAPSMVNDTIFPTIDSEGSMIPTSSGSLTPSLISSSFTPSMLNETLSPILTNVTDNATVTPSVSNASSAPSINNASAAPSINNASVAPSIRNASVAPSVFNISAAPSKLNASVAPSIFNASVAPSIFNASVAPSITTGNATFIPTPSPLVLNASTAPSVPNATLVPTSNFTGNGTSLVPTISLNVTASPSAENTTASSIPTSSNITASIAPTATLPPWEMRMYGMTDLEEQAQAVYEERTALYIESFYDGSSTEGIRGDISDMSATVQVVGQIPPTPIRASLNTRTSNIVVHHGKRQHTVKHSSNQGSLVQNKKIHRFGRSGRILQDPCFGSFLTLILKINITYNTLNDALTADEVLKEPFSTAEYRDDYLNNYLDDGSPGEEFFRDLTCTSEIIKTTPISKVPTPVPVVLSATPSITLGGNESLSPTIAVLSGNASYAPSILNASVAPSVLNASADPTSNFTNNETFLVPTLSPNVTASPSLGNIPNMPPTTPSNMTESIAPTSTNAGNLTNPSPPTSLIPTLISNNTTPPPVNEDIDDIFIDAFKSMRSGPSYDRKCSDIDLNTRTNAEEIEIKFVYGVETKSRKKYFIDELEDFILDYVTTSVLRCAEGDLQPSIRPRMTNNVLDFGVLRIRYSENGDITSITKKCIATSSAAKGCLVLSSKLLVTTTHSSVSEVHIGILKVLKDVFTEGIFTEFVSDVVLATYLGPDVNTSYSFALATDAPADYSSEGSIVIAIMFSITMVFVAAIWVCISSPLTRRELFDKIRSATTRRKRYHSLSVSNNSEEEAEVRSGNLAVCRDSDRDDDSQHSQHTQNLIR